ncbi:MAG: HAMP domain-containing sensor histidine kinase, partial [Calditrichia bacterium]
LRKNDCFRREFFADISHDLRSPLASMQGYLETLQIKEEQLTSEERGRYIDVIFSNLKLISDLVDEMYRLVRLETRQVQLNPERFAVEELLQDVILKLKQQSEKKEVHLSFCLPSRSFIVTADIGLIERAVSNVIGNAINYTPSRGRIRITLRSHKKAARITISDSGCGIAPEDLPFVFDRYYRSKKNRQNQGSRNSGLGLAIAKKILELHECSLFVESRLGAGTTFYFDLPAEIREIK